MCSFLLSFLNWSLFENSRCHLRFVEWLRPVSWLAVLAKLFPQHSYVDFSSNLATSSTALRSSISSMFRPFSSAPPHVPLQYDYSFLLLLLASLWSLFPCLSYLLWSLCPRLSEYSVTIKAQKPHNIFYNQVAITLSFIPTPSLQKYSWKPSFSAIRRTSPSQKWQSVWSSARDKKIQTSQTGSKPLMAGVLSWYTMLVMADYMIEMVRCWSK